MERAQIDNIEDIQQIVPGLSAGNDFAFAKIFIRGVGLNSSFPGVDPSVALHVDGAVISSSYSQLGAFFDLERVEVLRGPQGTLYGRNATGGSVNLITRRPTEEFSGYANVTVGNYDLLRLEGAVSGPITDFIRARLAYKSTNRSGYGQNITTGNDIDDADKKSIRASFEIDLAENVQLYLTGEHHEEDDRSLSVKFIEALSNLDPANNIPIGTGGFAESRRDTASEADNRNDRESSAINAVLDWDITENLRMQSISNYRTSEIVLIQDLDNSSNINRSIQTNTTTSEQYS